jgi:hypothetical protein
LGF